MKKAQKRGFTIVELVIVIAVVAILAAVLIPTFANLIEKANMSVDMQLVNQMNTVLQADEIVSGKPATVVDAKEILGDNGCDDFTPTETKNVFYWIGAENRVILWEKDEGDGVTTGKVTYPKEYAKKYEGVNEPSADWADLAQEYEVLFVEPEEGETVRQALVDAVEAAEDGAVLQLPEDSEVQLNQGGLYWLGESLVMDGGVGKHITVDLNGGTLVSSGSNAAFTKDENGNFMQDENGDYIMNILTVPENAELVLTNGSIDIQHGSRPSVASVMTSTGSSLILRDMDIATTTAGVLPAGDSSEVVIENCTINALNYALSTNRAESSRVRIIVRNSNLSATYATAVMINTSADAHIYDSTITGAVHGVILRAGTLEINDSTIVVNDTEPGVYSANNFAYGNGFQGFWGTGNTIPAGAIVVGDYTKPYGAGIFSYAGDSVLTLSNTKLQSAVDTGAVPEILIAAYDPNKTASVTYDDSCTVGDVVVYGSNWAGTDDNIGLSFTHPGTIKVNGVTESTVNYFHIPSWVGTFTEGEYSVSELDKNDPAIAGYDYNETVRDQIESAWGLTLTDAEWATVTMSFSSQTTNQLKTISYTKADGTAASYGPSRITLTGLGDLGLLNSQSVSVLKKSANYLDTFKAACDAAGITVTGASKFVVGETANVIVGVK